MPNIGDGNSGSVQFNINAGIPDTPSSGFADLFVDSDKLLYLKVDTGLVTEIGSGGSDDAVILAPASSTRNYIQPTGAYNTLGAKTSAGTLKWYFEESGDFITNAEVTTSVVIGDGAGRLNAGASVHIGNLAGAVNEGDASIFIGDYSGYSNVGGEYNIGIGSGALYTNVAGEENVGIGEFTLYKLASGNGNTGVGAYAGIQATSGTGNVFVGYSAGPTAEAAYSNKLWINNAQSNTPLIYGDFSTGLISINSAGGVGNTTINGAQVSANYDLGLVGDGVLMLKETATPTADTNYGKVYCKNDNKLYFQDGAGTEHEIAFV